MPRSFIRGVVLFCLVFAGLVVLVLSSRDEEAQTAAPLGDVASRVAATGLAEHRVPVLAVGADAAGPASERVRIAADASVTVRRSPNVIGELGDAAGRVVISGGHVDSVPEGLPPTLRHARQRRP